jgi:uncharacterized protein (DUF58 family)
MRGKLFTNRFYWAVFFLGACAGAWFFGERIFFVSAVVLVALPAVSFFAAYFLLRWLRVSFSRPDSVVKNSAGTIDVVLHNKTFVPLGGVDILIEADEHAVSVLENQTAVFNPFERQVLQIPFETNFRGFFEFRLKAVSLTDFTGLFRLKREFEPQKEIMSLPHVPDVSRFPLAATLMTQASSRHDIRDEDYSTISDIRQYLPTDSIKRVHWKLTAKRNEWLVKNFQSNALNLVSVILDSVRLPLKLRQIYEMEDSLTENTLGLIKFCLNKGMPVDFFAADGRKISAQHPGEFGVIYQAASELRFTPDATPGYAILSHVLNEAAGYVNAVVITSRLNAALYERIINGTNNGHYIAVLYFEPPELCEESEEICRFLIEGGLPCFRHLV